MFAMLPELTPRDSHSLWYTSPRNPSSALHPLDPSHSTADNGSGPQATTAAPPTTTPTTTPNPTQNTPAPPQTAAAAARQANAHSASATAQIIDRSALGRLQAEELLVERRRTAVTNLGSTWLKPVGVAKTLFQMREERREAEEHAEAMRREMLAQELADAAAQGVAEEEGQQPQGPEDEEMEEDGGVDLDADIPDEDAGMGFGYDGASDEDEEDEEEEEEEDDEEEEEEEEELSEEELERRQEIARIRATEARMREVSEQNDANLRRSDSIFDFDEEPSDEDRSQLLEEEDLVRGHPHPQADVQVPGPVDAAGHDMDMDADLDDDIPEADGGGYEHTDSEASLDSGDEGHDISYARSSRMVHGRSSVRRSQAPRSSLDISGLLSRDGSSMAGSSPHMRRGNY